MKTSIRSAALSLPFVFGVLGCSSSDTASGNESHDAGGDSSLPTECHLTLTGSVAGESDCKPSLCTPDLADRTTWHIHATAGLVIESNVWWAASPTPGNYSTTDLDPETSIRAQTDVSFAYPYYVARGGSSAKADEAISIVVDSVTPSSALPCDGTIHGTLDATLVEQTAENVPGPGRETLHIEF